MEQPWGASSAPQAHASRPVWASSIDSGQLRRRERASIIGGTRKITRPAARSLRFSRSPAAASAAAAATASAATASTAAATATAATAAAAAAAATSAATVAASSEAATAAASTEAAAAAATATRRALLRFVDAQGTTVELRPVHLLDGGGGCAVVQERHEAKAAGAASLAIGDDLDVIDLAEALECPAKGGVVGIPAQAAHE
jgi:hypothetical protein